MRTRRVQPRRRVSRPWKHPVEWWSSPAARAASGGRCATRSPRAALARSWSPTSTRRGRSASPARWAAPRCAHVTREADVVELVGRTIAAHGAVDIYCSNAGVAVGGGPDAPDRDWQRSWEVHVMAHVYAARALLPGMLARGEGYFIGTASAAALLNHIA